MANYYLKVLSTGKIYYAEDSSGEYRHHDQVLIDTDQAVEPALVIGLDKKIAELEEKEVIPAKIVRMLKAEDRCRFHQLKIAAQKFIPECREKIKKHGLEMKLLDADLSFDEKKLTFYFGAEGRIDFRGLVADLVASFHKIIRLQQVGPRDEAKFFGGLGKCGRELCCMKFLKDMESITLDLAKVQDMAGVGSQKISGACGKLMCCLAYEAEFYEKIRAKLPQLGDEITIPQGKGKVKEVNILEQTVLVELGPNEVVEHKF